MRVNRQIYGLVTILRRIIRPSDGNGSNGLPVGPYRSIGHRIFKTLGAVRETSGRGH